MPGRRLSPRLADLDTNLIPTVPACNSVTGGLSYTFSQNGGAAEVAPAQSPAPMTPTPSAGATSAAPSR